MNAAALTLLDESGGIATTGQLLTVMSRQQLDVRVRNGELVRVWRGIYSTTEPDLHGRLAALDVLMGQRAVVCMGTAASLYGFDMEDTKTVHVLDPGVRMRPTTDLMVHQRVGAPLQRIAGRLATTPAWTAVEVARQLRRPRALATLDAAVHVNGCTRVQLDAAVREQKGRRGIVQVRELLSHVDGRAESAMESEARLVMIDYGLPLPELQYEIRGLDGTLYRVDFAWPKHRVAAEYESVDWHVGRLEMLRDKKRYAGVQEVDWTMVPITVDDVRREPWRLAERLRYHLSRSAAAS
jgi:hypothetical protein